MAEALMVHGVAVVAYVDGVAVDSEGKEVKGAPKESPVTDPSQQPHAMAALNTEERSAAILANALAVALGRQPAPVASSGSAGSSATAVDLPTLAVLPDVLATYTSVAQVRALQAQDDRVGAKKLYEARVAELGG